MPRPSGRPIERLSETTTVRMDDDWFEIASAEHFWLRRRLDVLLELAGPLLHRRARIAEIGCGTGVVQRQLEDRCDVTVDGFDLNLFALERNLSHRGRLACYNVLDRREDLAGRYDVVLLLDVIEHVDEEDAFVAGARHLLAPGGSLVVNVPAVQALYSSYDREVGHVRRYAPRDLAGVAGRASLVLRRWTYWGLPLLPLALARKWFVRSSDPARVVKHGMQPPGHLANRALHLLARCEPIPQRVFGTSLLAVLSRERDPRAGAGEPGLPRPGAAPSGA